MAIFISYRREDTAGETGRLYDHLVTRYGQEGVFRDIDAIRPGTNFVRRIEDVIGSANVVVAVIGRDWLTSADTSGELRLANPNDFVRVELAAALEKGTLLIPVLMQGASMPSKEDLPDGLKPLAQIQALEVSESRWNYDVGRLVLLLDERIAPTAEGRAEIASARSGERALRREPQPSAPDRGDVRRRFGTKHILAGGLFIAVLVGAAVVLAMQDSGEGPRRRVPPPDDRTEPSMKLPVSGIEATGTDISQDQDGCGNPVTFEPQNMLDQEPNTAWRTSGDGVGQEITVVLDRPRVLTELSLIPGYAKVDPCNGTRRFPQNRTISEVMLHFDDGSSVIGEFRPRPDLQAVALDVETQTIVIEILRTAPPTARPPTANLGGNTAIAEIEVYGS